MGGGGGSHTLPNHVTGSGRSTRNSQRVITLRPGALLEISFLFLNSSTPIKSIHYLCDWGRRYSQVRFPTIHLWSNFPCLAGFWFHVMNISWHRSFKGIVLSDIGFQIRLFPGRFKDYSETASMKTLSNSVNFTGDHWRVFERR